MLVCRPSQHNEKSISKNDFMSISTTTKGFDGVIEVFDLYINSIKNLSPLENLSEIFELNINFSL